MTAERTHGKPPTVYSREVALLHLAEDPAYYGATVEVEDVDR